MQNLFKNKKLAIAFLSIFTTLLLGFIIKETIFAAALQLCNSVPELTFDSVPNSPTTQVATVDKGLVTTQYLAEYGFSLKTGNRTNGTACSIASPRIIKAGGGQDAFFILDTPVAGETFGPSFIRSDIDFGSTKTSSPCETDITFDIAKKPHFFGFDIIDITGAEKWTIMAYDDPASVTPLTQVIANASSPNAGVGKATPISLISQTPIGYIRIVPSSAVAVGTWGYAFDNFTPACAVLNPWLVVRDAVAAINGGILNSTIPNASFASPYDGTTINGFLSNVLIFATNSAIPTAKLSETLRYSTAYEDSSMGLPNDSSSTDWYSYLLQKAQNNKTIALTNSTVSSITTKVSTSMGATVDKDYNWLINGNLTIAANTTCDVKGLFFVNGDITITTSFKNSSFQNGCVFVSSGNINVTNTSTSTVTLGYESFEGFFIADNFITNFDTVTALGSRKGILIKGGVLSQAMDLNRDLLKTNSTKPAEIFQYDPRFRLFFSSIFTANSYSLREVTN